ncbi:hypothetical protein EXIGLDRAFT_766266 [Exidia glandulosa HHB12029]|uniref:SET domain-containing protein n=1 Tax=Exidia glandulosa HHB12029 TaxID=1314781 RepID=A0A165JUK2_EXIGL|nr:hypothetical protein EXIGLDRAFT_766266 [Exidia glandulosa HHB12029]
MENEERDKAVDAYEQAWKAFYAWNSEEAQRILSSLGGESTTVSSDSVSGSVSGEGGDAANEWVVADEMVVSEDESWLQTFTEESSTTVRITRPVVLLDMIELEAARLMASERGDGGSMKVGAEIDAMRVLSRPLQESNECGGLMTDTWQRDVPLWPEFVDRENELGDIFDEFLRRDDREKTGLREHFEDFIKSGCFRSSCIEPSCSSHGPAKNCVDELAMRFDLEEFRARSKETCGDECFLAEVVEPSKNGLWTEKERDDLRLIVSQCPELSSCELAVVSDKSCREVYVERQHLEDETAEVSGMASAAVAEDGERTLGVTGGASAGEHGNVKMGSEMPTKTFVAEGAYGFGLFARDLIPKDSLVGEYTGEVLCDGRALSQAVIGEHIERNYVFDFEEYPQNDVCLDALEAGNATRFINHADKERANAVAKRKWVNGDMKIGIYATREIRKNDEIFMDYGARYFKKKEEGKEIEQKQE